MPDRPIPAHQAELALDLAQAEPARATELASAALEHVDLPPSARVRALWALGLGRRELDDLEGADSALRLAITSAEDMADPALAAEITSSLAWSMARTGRLEEALRLTDEAAPRLEGAPGARNEMQRGLILHRLGRNRDALSSFEISLAGLETAGDLLAAARLRLNRSVIHVYSGHLDEAVADLEEAYRIALDQGQTLLEAACAHNLGFTHGRRGDIPLALRWLDTAEQIFTDLGGRQRKATLRSDRAEILAEAGLIRDAQVDIEAAVSELRTEEDLPALADALLFQARVADLAGDGQAAAESAGEARRLFSSQNRRSWELLARYHETLASVRRSDGPADLAEVLDLVHRLEEERWDTEARRLRLAAARAVFDDGSARDTLGILEPLEQATPPSPPDRVAHAEAAYMLARLRGEEREARRAIRRGLDILDRYRSGVGSPEVRAGMARHGIRLVHAAVDDALAAGHPWRVFLAVDAWRAQSVDYPPALPPDDAELAASLSRLRGVENDLREAKAVGGDTTGLLSLRRRIETRVQRITRQVESRTERTVSRPSRSDLVEALEDRSIVSYFHRQDSIHAVSYGKGWQLRDLGRRSEVADLVDALLFALHRLATGRGSQASLEAAARSMKDAGSRLSQMLVEPLGLPDGPLVVVPTGILHRLPWQALPALRGRPVSVAPSARAWMRSARRPPPPGRIALVAGPELPGGRREVERLARLYPDARQLTGRNARTERVLSLLDGAAVAHLAAHGTFRTDNPLFSSLRMADGPLTVYDLERLNAVPPVVVMPSCESAVSDVGVGDELLGLAAALLRIGTSSLVAPTVAISDLDTLPLMVSLHRGIRAGRSPAVALGEAIAAGGSDSPREIAARSGFIALGA